MLPGIPFCVVLSSPNLFYMFWVPVLGFHAILLALYLYQGYRVLFGASETSGMLGLVYRDALINFLA